MGARSDSAVGIVPGRRLSGWSAAASLLGVIVWWPGAGEAAPSQAGPASAPAASVGGALARPKNVLFIAIDDLRPELGCYGVGHARTPRLDEFARSGMLFERHFTPAPSCGPSRYALLTGRSPASSGALGNEALYRGATQLSSKETPRPQSVPELFRRRGFRTVCIGKISHTPDGRVYAYDGTGDGRPELPHAWDELPTPFGPWKRGWGAFFAYPGGAHREDGGGHADLMDFTARADTDLPDGLLAQAAAERLAELGRGGQPFFMGVGFYKPHLPFVAPAADLAAMELVDIPLPLERERPKSAYVPRSGEFRRYRARRGSELVRGKLPTKDADVLRDRRAYLACVRYVDRQVGTVLDALEEADLADSTVVVIWGDHGWHLGDSGAWGKHSLLDRSLRSVLMVRAPGVTSPGSRTKALVSTVDLAPTLFDLSGLAEPEMTHPMDGVSIRPLLDGSEANVRDHVAGYYGKAATLRTKSHRLLARRSENGWRDVRLFEMDGVTDPPFARWSVPPLYPVRGLARELLSKLRPLDRLK